MKYAEVVSGGEELTMVVRITGEWDSQIAALSLRLRTTIETIRSEISSTILKV